MKIKSGTRNIAEKYLPYTYHQSKKCIPKIDGGILIDIKKISIANELQKLSLRITTSKSESLESFERFKELRAMNFSNLWGMLDVF